MKARLSSTIWLLVLWIGVTVSGALGLAYYAGAHSVAQAADASSVPGGASGALFGAGALAVLGAFSIVFVMSRRVLKPVDELAKFSERLVAGDSRARLELESGDEFEFIAENFNRSAAKVAHAVTNQQAQDSLQRSITDLLNTIKEVARGDLTIRGKVTNDALGNVVDSVNFMLDNFTKVLERVRKAAIDVSTSANQILEAADDMTAGATQQDQEITNTSSAVEELTVSMNKCRTTRKPVPKQPAARWTPPSRATAPSATRSKACSAFALRCRPPRRKSNRSATVRSKFPKLST